jgi:hypothetical protein
MGSCGPARVPACLARVVVRRWLPASFGQADAARAKAAWEAEQEHLRVRKQATDLVMAHRKELEREAEFLRRLQEEIKKQALGETVVRRLTLQPLARRTSDATQCRAYRHPSTHPFPLAPVLRIRVREAPEVSAPQ